MNKAYIASFTEALTQTGYVFDKKLEKFYMPYVNKSKEETRKFIEKYGALPFAMAPELSVKESMIETAARTNDVAIITIGRISVNLQIGKLLRVISYCQMQNRT